MRSTALLVIDMLNDFIAEGAPLEVPEARKIVPAVRKKIEESRRKGNCRGTHSRDTNRIRYSIFE